MELLEEIFEKDVGIQETPCENYELRRAARAVLFNKEDLIAFVYVSKDEYHKLPGGGLKVNEGIHAGLAREVLEETGCFLGVVAQVGRIIEYKNAQAKLQKSYCFMAKTVAGSGKPHFTEKEQSKGFKLNWVSLDEAIDLLENDFPTDYTGKFIVKRDLTFLRKAKEMLSDNKTIDDLYK